LHQKNDKRGEWVTIAGIRTLRAKKGKDCYLVRPMATRTTGLPDARNVEASLQDRPAVAKNSNGKSESTADPKTLKLLKDIRKATIAYTRHSMADSSIPTQIAINEAWAILGEAHTQIAKIGDDTQTQVKDRKLTQLTNLMFSRIPRRKKVGAAADTWVLSQHNIQDWHDDLDTFESALKAIGAELHTDILGEMNLDMQWIDPTSPKGELLHQWCPQASANRHPKMKGMTIKNLWEVSQFHAKGILPKTQQRILKSKVDLSECPSHQLKTRTDIASKQRRVYKDSNTALLLHATRCVNVNAILRESLRMPETLVAVALTGAKFGQGIYFADDWKNAANYSNAKGSAEAGDKGAVKGRNAFMFAADVVLGTAHVADNVQGFTKPPRGHHSVFGKADHSGVDDNEFIVYKTDQFKLRYLIEFRT